MAEPSNAPAVRDGREIYRDLRGELVSVDPAKANELLAKGQIVAASKEEVAQADRQADLQTNAAIAETFLKSGLNAAAAPVVWGAQKLGLGDPRDIGMTAEEAAAYHQREAELAAANPWAAMGGQVVGSTLGLKGMGVMRGAAAASRAVGGGLAGTIASGAIEGAAFGASAEMDQDPRASVEHVLAAGGMGALLGAGGNTLLYGAGKGLSKVFGRAIGNDLEVAAAQEAAASLERDGVSANAKGGVAKMWDDITGKVSGAPKELLEEVGPTGTRRAEAIKAAQGYDEWANKTALEMQHLSNEASASLEDVTRVVSDHHLKEGGIRDLTGKSWDTEGRRRFSAAMLQGVRNEFSESLESLPNIELLPAPVRKQLDLMDRQMQHSLSSFEGDLKDSAGRYIVLDDLKRNLQKTVLKMRVSASESKVYDTFERDALLGAAKRVEEVQEKLRQNLMNKSYWGDAVASAQSEVNAVWAEGAIDALDNYGHQFQRWTGQWDYETGRKIFEADPAKMLSTLKSVGTANGAIAERTMGQYLYHLDQLVEKIGDKFMLSPEAQEAVETARTRFAKLRELYDEARDRTELADKFRKLETYKAGGLMNSAAILGGVIGHAPGAAVGSALNAAANPAATARFIDGISGAAQRWTSTNLLEGVGKWVESGASNASRLTKEIGNVSRGTTTSAAVHLFRGNYKSDDEAMDHRVRALLSADPATLGTHLEGLPDENMFHAGAAASAALEYLRSKLPPYLGSPSLLQSTKRLAMSRPDQVQFARVWGTVADPSTAVRDLRAGRLTPAQADALASVYPRLYEDMRNRTLEAIGVADARGKPIPIHMRGQLATLLKLDGAGEPALSGGFADRVRGLMASNQQNQKPRAPRLASNAAGKVVAATLTPFDRAMG